MIGPAGSAFLLGVPITQDNTGAKFDIMGHGNALVWVSAKTIKIMPNNKTLAYRQFVQKYIKLLLSLGKVTMSTRIQAARDSSLANSGLTGSEQKAAFAEGYKQAKATQHQKDHVVVFYNGGEVTAYGPATGGDWAAKRYRLLCHQTFQPCRLSGRTRRVTGSCKVNTNQKPQSI